MNFFIYNIYKDQTRIQKQIKNNIGTVTNNLIRHNKYKILILK